jgi:hypothetical protein
VLSFREMKPDATGGRGERRVDGGGSGFSGGRLFCRRRDSRARLNWGWALQVSRAWQVAVLGHNFHLKTQTGLNLALFVLFEGRRVYYL